MTKIAGSGSRIRIRIRIRIHLSEVWIRGSGSTPKCHGSATLAETYELDPYPAFCDKDWKILIICFFPESSMNVFAEEKPPALQREHPTFQRQHYFSYIFCWSSLPSWIRMRIPKPDRGLRTRMNPVPEIIDPVFAKTSPKRSFCMTENERFGLVFVKTGSINSGTDPVWFRNTIFNSIRQWC